MPYPVPMVDEAAYSAALAARPHKFAVIPEEAYDRMLACYTELGPKKFKYRLIDLHGTIRTVRFDKGAMFYYEDKGFMVLLGFKDARVESVVGHIPGSEEQELIRETNYTGNRHRNRTVRVPTEPGQPVRG